jgi:hypothetical protein
MPTVIRRAACMAAFGLLAAFSSSATAQEPAAETKTKRQCFTSRDVTGFNALDDRTVNLRVGVRDVYRLELFGACPEIDWTNEIAIQARGGSWICSGMDAVIIAPSTIGPQRCMVRSIRKLEPAEVEALSDKDKP